MTTLKSAEEHDCYTIESQRGFFIGAAFREKQILELLEGPRADDMSKATRLAHPRFWSEWLSLRLKEMDGEK